MSLNNDNNLQCVSINLGSLTADTSDPLPALYCERGIEVKSAQLINNADIAASDSDYISISLKSGSDEIAELDSRAAHENGLSKAVAEQLNVVAAEAEREAGETLTVDYQETGTIALTNAVLCVWFRNK